VLKASGVFAKTIEYIASKLASDHLDIFVNVRCDTYILDVADKELETRIRLKAYESAGANGVFLPCICSKEDISDAVAHTTLPINVMCIPGLPGFDILKDLGVKRISMGPVMFNKVYGHLDEIAQTLYKS
jgi:2-methylisocitrate lyase-like PEP mutase family enzyme